MEMVIYAANAELLYLPAQVSADNPAGSPGPAYRREQLHSETRLQPDTSSSLYKAFAWESPQITIVYKQGDLRNGDFEFSAAQLAKVNTRHSTPGVTNMSDCCALPCYGLKRRLHASCPQKHACTLSVLLCCGTKCHMVQSFDCWTGVRVCTDILDFLQEYDILIKFKGDERILQALGFDDGDRGYWREAPHLYLEMIIGKDLYQVLTILRQVRNFYLEVECYFGHIIRFL